METVNVLVTGAASALGSAVVAALRGAGYAVRATDTIQATESGETTTAGQAGAAGPEFRQGDLTDPAFVAGLLQEVQAIVHLAPLSLVRSMPAGAPGEILDAATRGTHVLLKAAVEAGITQVVQGSTLAVMDAYDDDLEVTEQWRPRPRPVPEELAPYLSELVAREFTRDPQVAAPPSVVCLRFAPSEAGDASAAVDPRALPAAEAAQAVVKALAAVQEGVRQRGHRWLLYHVAALSPEARYTSQLAQRELGYGQ